MIKGAKYYNNGSRQILIHPGDTIPNGFVLGGLSKGKGRKTHNAGKIAVHKDGKNIYVLKDEVDQYLALGYECGGSKLSEESSKSKREKTKLTYENKSQKDLDLEHQHRSEGAANMWALRTEEENYLIRHQIGTSIWENKSEEQKAKKVQELHAGLKVWKENLSDEDYNNFINSLSDSNKKAWEELSPTQRIDRIEKQKMSLLNRTDEQKEISLNKFRATLASKDEAFWENKALKAKETIANRTPEEAECIHNHRVISSYKAAQNRAPEVEAERRLKISIAEKNRSPEEWRIIKEKTANTNAQKTPEEKLEIIEKQKATLNLNKSFSNTKLEKRCEEFLKNNNFNYKPHYYIKTNGLGHEFDFAIFDDNSNLIMLIDCDGLYFHGFISDEDGKNVNTYVDDYRSLVVPENIKFHIIYESIEQECYSDLLKLINIDYEEYLNQIFSWCRQFEFPFPKYNSKILERSYQSLIKADSNKFSPKALFGMNIIKNFHPSIYKCNIKNHKSPYEVWQDDAILIKAIKNRIVYKGTKLDPSKILNGMNVTKVAPKISIFNPFLAKYLIEKYLIEFDTIFDPFSGFSGRMLGACAVGKNYIGYDINPSTIAEAQEIKDYFDLSANLTCKDSFETKHIEVYDCLLTCPPYKDKESWGQDIEILSCDEWIDKCINTYKCKKYVFVVDDTEKYKDYVTEEIINKSHFNTNKEKVIVICR